MVNRPAIDIVPDLDEFGAWMRSLGLDALADEADERAADGQRTVLVHVLGPGKAGKSSLINALAGAEVAAVGNLPLTWKVDIYQRADGSATHAVLHFADGRAETVSLEDAQAACTREEERGKEARRCGDMYVSPLVGVTRWVDAPGLPPGVALVDTPGLSQEGRSTDAPAAPPKGISVSIRTRERALELLNRADLILWAMRASLLQGTANSPLRDALTEQGGLERPVMAVLTHWDRLAPERQDEALAVARDLFGAVVDDFEPATLKAGQPGFEETVDRLRARLRALVGEDSASTRDAMTSAWVRESAGVAARVLEAKALAMAQGLVTLKARRQDARRLVEQAATTYTNAIDRVVTEQAKLARARAAATVSRNLVSENEQIAEQAAKVFVTEVLRPSESERSIREALSDACEELAELVSEVGARIELPVVRVVDRRGHAEPSAWSLGWFPVTAPTFQLDAKAWTDAVTKAGNLWEGLGDWLFRAKAETLSVRFGRGVDRWEEAARESQRSALAPIPRRLLDTLGERLDAALTDAHGLPKGCSVESVLAETIYGATVCRAWAGDQRGVGLDPLKLLHADIQGETHAALRRRLDRCLAFCGAILPASQALDVVELKHFHLADSGSAESSIAVAARQAVATLRLTPLETSVADTASGLLGPVIPARRWSPSTGWATITCVPGDMVTRAVGEAAQAAAELAIRELLARDTWESVDAARAKLGELSGAPAVEEAELIAHDTMSELASTQQAVSTSRFLVGGGIFSAPVASCLGCVNASNADVGMAMLVLAAASLVCVGIGAIMPGQAQLNRASKRATIARENLRRARLHAHVLNVAKQFRDQLGDATRASTRKLAMDPAPIAREALALVLHRLPSHLVE